MNYMTFIKICDAFHSFSRGSKFGISSTYTDPYKHISISTNENIQNAGVKSLSVIRKCTSKNKLFVLLLECQLYEIFFFRRVLIYLITGA